MTIDFARLSGEEVAAIARQALGALSGEQKIAVIMEALEPEELAELSEKLEG